ncbi:MAG: TolC family outer membrane protein [Magnetovibrio sp.]|nr:TolC family outer membrane protein [Magnetovibrio sp.]
MNKHMRLFPVLAACTYVGASLFSVTTSQAQPIEHELKYLIDSHPKIREAEKTLESRRSSVKESQALYYPTVTVTGEVGPEVVSNPTTRAAGNGNPSSKPMSTVNLTISQNIFDGFATTSQVRVAKLNREVAELSLEGTRQSTLFEGVRAYINILRQRRLMEMARENERTIQRQLNLEDERVRRGSGVTVDVLQAKSRLQIAKERRVGYEGALQNAISTYEQVFGHAPQLATMIDPSPPPEVIPSTLDRATEIALMENPALIGGATNVELTREQRRGSNSGFYPIIDLEGSANYENNLSTTNGITRDYAMKLSATWELFSGGSTLAQNEISNFGYSASIDIYEYTSTKVVEQTRLSWQSLLTSRERRRLLGNAVNIAAEVFDSRKKLRDAGKETVINVLDAENEVNNAQINYTTATYDERVSIYQLLLAMGRLMPEYMISSR